MTESTAQPNSFLRHACQLMKGTCPNLLCIAIILIIYYFFIFNHFLKIVRIHFLEY